MNKLTDTWRVRLRTQRCLFSFRQGLGARKRAPHDKPISRNFQFNKTPAYSKAIRFLGSSALLACASLGAVPEGAMLAPPVAGRTLVAPSAYRLNTVELRPEVEVVIFFYSASWCGPCKQAAQALRSAYPEIVAAEPRIEVLTYSLDRSPDARADYLCAAQFPWPAIAPERIGPDRWPTAIAGGTPQFQAFNVSEQQWQAITTPGDAPSIFKQAFAILNKREFPPPQSITTP